MEPEFLRSVIAELNEVTSLLSSSSQPALAVRTGEIAEKMINYLAKSEKVKPAVTVPKV
jgi:hypothetical protein